MARVQSIASAVVFALAMAATACGNTPVERPTPTLGNSEVKACEATEIAVANVPRIPRSDFASGVVIRDEPLFRINDDELMWRWANDNESALCGNDVDNCAIVVVPAPTDLEDRPLTYEDAERGEMQVGLLSPVVAITLEATYGPQTTDGQTTVFINAVGPGDCLIDGDLTISTEDTVEFARMENGVAEVSITAGCGLYTVSLKSDQLPGQTPTTMLDASGDKPPPQLVNSDVIPALAGRCSPVFELELQDACTGQNIRGWTLNLESDEFAVGVNGLCDNDPEHFIDTSAAVSARPVNATSTGGEIGITATTPDGAETKRTLLVPVMQEDQLRAVVRPTANPVGCFPIVLEIRSGSDLVVPPPNTQVDLQILNNNLTADTGLFTSEECSGLPMTDVVVNAAQTTLYLNWSQPDEVTIQSTLNVAALGKVNIYELVVSGPRMIYAEECASLGVEAMGRDGPIQLREPIDIEAYRVDTGPNRLSIASNCNGPASLGTFQLTNGVSPGDSLKLKADGSGYYYLRATVRNGLAASDPIRVRGGRCGDDIIQPGEACDGVGEFGCMNCQLTPGYICAGEPSACGTEIATLHVRRSCSVAVPTCVESVSAALERVRALGVASTILVLEDVPFGPTVIDTNEPQIDFDIQVVASRETQISSSGPLLFVLAAGKSYAFRGGVWVVDSGSAFDIGETQLELRDLTLRGQGPTTLWGVETNNGGSVQILRSQIENFAFGGLNLFGTGGALIENLVVTSVGSSAAAIEVDLQTDNTRFVGITTRGYETGLICYQETAFYASAIGPAASAMQSNCRFIDSVVASAAYGTGIEASSALADPRLRPTGELRVDSPCRDHGQSEFSYLAPIDDRDGNPRPLLSDFDCGAVEFW